MKPSTVEETRTLFETSFGGPAKIVGKVEEIVPETVFEFRVEHKGRDRIARMYCGLGNALAGHLWQQEAQSLGRFSGKQHPALPRVVDAYFRDEEGVGLIVSERIGRVMTAEDTAQLRANPMVAFRFLSLAADAVRALHSHGLIHRDIWRGSFAIRTQEADDDTPPSACLFGFEMSAFVASLIDPVWRTAESDGEPLRAYLARGGQDRRLFRAPEMHGQDGIGTAYLTYRSDIFSLGVCAFEWFINELPPELVHPASGPPAEPPQIVSTLLKRIGEARHVPEPLRALLRDMLPFEPRIRPTAGVRGAHRGSMGPSGQVRRRSTKRRSPQHCGQAAPSTNTRCPGRSFDAFQRGRSGPRTTRPPELGAAAQGGKRYESVA